MISSETLLRASDRFRADDHGTLMLAQTDQREPERRLGEHLTTVRAVCQRLGISHVQISTTQPLEMALFDFLKVRADRGKIVRRRAAA